MYTKLHITILKKIRKLLISMIRIKWLVAETISGASTGLKTANAGTEKINNNLFPKILYQ